MWPCNQLADRPTDHRPTDQLTMWPCNQLTMWPTSHLANCPSSLPLLPSSSPPLLFSFYFYSSSSWKRRGEEKGGKQEEEKVKSTPPHPSKTRLLEGKSRKKGRFLGLVFSFSFFSPFFEIILETEKISDHVTIWQAVQLNNIHTTSWPSPFPLSSPPFSSSSSLVDPWLLAVLDAA